MGVMYAVPDVHELAVERGQDFKALAALSRTLNSHVVDLSGTLNWPWPSTRIRSIRETQAKHPNDCVDECAGAIAAEHGHVVVKSGGEPGSTAIVCALLKHGANLEVRYVRGNVRRNPRVFAEIFNDSRITLVDRTNLPIMDGAAPFVDARAVDGLLARQIHTTLGNWWPLVYDTLDNFIDAVSAMADHPADLHAGLTRFATSAPFMDGSAWSLCVALYRCCKLQSDVLTTIMVEPDPALALANRLPFYDDAVFDAASHWVVANGPQNNGAFKEYVEADVGFDPWGPDHEDDYWPGVPPDTWAQSHWLDDQHRLRPYAEFPEVTTHA